VAPRAALARPAGYGMLSSPFRLESGQKRRFRMSLQGHIVELQRRHEALKKEIAKEQHHPRQDDRRILELKRKKLQIKDELLKLKTNETHH
jgi:hypothetical protein